MVTVRYISEYDYPRFSPNKSSTHKKHPTKKDRPYLLEHVFDISKNDYVSNINQCCYYNPVNIEDYNVVCKDDGIVTVTEDGFIVGEMAGSTSIFIENPNYLQQTEKDASMSAFYLNVIVSNRNVKPNKLNETLFLLKDNMIHLKTVLSHIHCPHYNNCIFDRKLWNIYDDPELKTLVEDIKTTHQKIKDYTKIIEDYRNNIITYHPDLDKYYNINIIDGIVEVNVTLSFIKSVKGEINSLKLLLKDLNRKRNIREQKIKLK